MIKTQNVINALPLVADALGRKYGVKIHIGGERAFTNGNEIHLPSLPLDADENILNLARGYLDHEAAHIRITDFNVLNSANIDKLEKSVWNILEDFMVERRIAEIYAGCKQNLEWLARYLFLGNTENESQHPAEMIFNWLLRAVRSLALPELEELRDKCGKNLDGAYPGLREKLVPLVMSVPDECIDTTSCLQKAHEIMAVIQGYAKSEYENQKQKEDENRKNSESSQSDATPNNEATSSQHESAQSLSQQLMQENKENKSESGQPDAQTENIEKPEKTLEEYLANPDTLPTFDMGQQAGELLQGESITTTRLTVATPTPLSAMELSQEEITKIRAGTAALRTRLQAVLQSKILTRACIGTVGRIETGRIARLAVNDPKIFARTNSRTGVNTAVHILLDASGSMHGTKKTLAANACYALACALNNVPGVSVAVTAFPGTARFIESDGEMDWNTVSSVKTWRQRLHNRFNISCSGYTPMAEALWWALQDMQNVKEHRKIILILSDGEPQSMEEAKTAIQTHRTCGNEVYGIGIETNSMQRLVSEKYARSIYELKELAMAMFDMLGSTLNKRKGD